MDFLNVIIAAFQKFGVSVSHYGRLGWLGGPMIKDPKKLSDVQDTVWNDPRWKATTAGGVETTHCNQGSLAVANGMGCHSFDPPMNGEPYTADQIFNFFANIDKGANFLEKDMADVQALVNAGSLIFACVPSWLLKEAHGHIVTLTPGAEVFSGGLEKNVPICLNISTAQLSARSIGINFAFPMKVVTPRFFAWKELL